MVLHSHLYYIIKRNNGKGENDYEKTQATQSQKLMVFVLTMSLYGLATLFTELIPKSQVGIVEISVEYFLFIPLVLGMLVAAVVGCLCFRRIR